jgi:hypothetical protein
MRRGVNYAEDGRPIDSFNQEDTSLKSVIPESAGEAAFRAVCDYMAKKISALRIKNSLRTGEAK